MLSPTDTKKVGAMFDRIAPTYDLLNSLLSLGAHKVWESKTVNALQGDSQGKVVDLCTGTGALVPKLRKKFDLVTGVDISSQMLSIAKKRYANLSGCIWIEADAQNLPFEDGAFSGASVSYGIRNLPDPLRGLSEIARICKSGSYLAVLEFGQPDNKVWRSVFGLYSKWIIPLIGRVISGDRDAYAYLPETSKNFPCGAAFEKLLREAGWTPLKAEPLFGGIAYLYTAQKRAGDSAIR